MEADHQKPLLSNQAFWDVDIHTIDFNKNARFIVEKVLERGTHQDFVNILRFYGREQVEDLVKKASWLSYLSINFCCKLFNIRPEDFKCYEKKQLNREHWNF